MKFIREIISTFLWPKQKAFIFHENPKYKRTNSFELCSEESNNPWETSFNGYIGAFIKSKNRIKKEHAVAIHMVKTLNIPKPKILEIGCSMGRYKEIFKTSGIDVEYYGCDISSEFIKIARAEYCDDHPERFTIEDATKLSYGDNYFDIAMLGGVLQYVQNYEGCLKEAIRVSKKYVILHRVTVIHESPTRYYKREVYGKVIPEIHFNEQELTELLSSLNLSILRILNSKVFHAADGIMTYIKSYLCRKVS